MYTLSFIQYCGAFNLFYLVAIVIFWHHTKRVKSDVLKLSLIYFVGTLVAIYSMVLSPSFPPRAWFGVIIFNIIALGTILFSLNYEYKFIRQIRFGVLLLGSIAFIFSLYPAMKDVYGLHLETKSLFKFSTNILFLN